MTTDLPRASSQDFARPDRQSRLIAFLLSLWLPGLGQVYSGLLKRALVFWFLALAAALVFSQVLLTVGFVAAAAGVALVAVVRLVAATDAVRTLGEGPEMSAGFRPAWRQVKGCVAIGIGVSLVTSLVLTQVFPTQTFKAGSSNMEPTLLPGDRFVVDRAAFATKAPQRGDLVALDRNEAVLVMRIVAVGGDVLEIRSKQLLLNGEMVEEPYVRFFDPRTSPKISPPNDFSRRDHMDPFQIPSGHVFVLGDSRDRSYDSRFWGTVPENRVVGRLLYLYWSQDRERIGLELE